MYSAVVLDEKSHLKLSAWADSNVKVLGIRLPILVRDNGWQMICHHMTINMGELPNYLKQYLGTTQKLEVTHIGVSPMAVAVRVIGFESKNKIPHITVAINSRGGGKPVMSNQITDWKPIDSTIKLVGEVRELQ